MQKIIVLPEHIIAKIAAGEVIERPVYAVKELIENAIDAHATSLAIHIEDAGLKRITVIDNGDGMSKKDLQECFKRHTTSKIKEEDELLCIKTLGFRGEALASIAAISYMTITSRRKGDAGGIAIALHEGKVEEIKPIGIPIGTTVSVENLFISVPARKKFLKSKQTEFRHITDLVIHYALSYPSIHFLLTHNKKTIFDLATIPHVTQRIKMLLGNDVFEHVIPLTYQESYIKISGFIGKPSLATANQQKQFLFVNNRKVSDKLIALAVKEAFGTLLPSSSYPVFILYLSLPFETIDVNVHPRKEQVSFLNSRMIFDAVKLAVGEALNSNNLTFNLVKFKNDISAKKGETTSFAGTVLRETVLPWNKKKIDVIDTTTGILQMHNTYLVTATKEGMILIDQHAAHERILYEEFITAFENEKNKQRNYLLHKPLSFDLSITESLLFEEFASAFSTIGFEIDHMQGTTFVVRKAPLLFKGRNVKKIITEMLAEFAEDKTPKSIDIRSQRMLAFLACRAAIKSGDPITQAQATVLIKQLEEKKNNTTCPHGRPTRIAITVTQLQNMFKRNS